MAKKPLHFDLTQQSAKLRFDELSEQTIKNTKLLLLDTLACIASGSSAKGIAECVEAVKLLEGKEQAKIFGFNLKTSIEKASFVNSAMGHARDFDDTHDLSVIHSGVVILPAMLAVAGSSLQDKKISGKEFLTAFSSAVNFTNRLGLAFIQYMDTGWMPTTLFGPFGCVIGCGMLLELTTAQILEGLGIAYSYINGNRQTLTEAELMKRIQPGIASSNGILATVLASKGITGPKDIFDGKYGFSHLYAQDKIDTKQFNVSSQNHFEINNLSLKPYPSCRCTHAVIDAVYELKQKYNLKQTDINSGVIYLTLNAMGQIGSPFTVRTNPTVDAQFSATYTAALTLIEGLPRLSHFEPDFITSRQDIIELTKKFTCVTFAEDKFGEAPAEIVLRLQNKQEVRSKIEHPKGSPQNPLQHKELIEKVSDCFSISRKAYTQQTLSQITNLILNLENVSDINQLIDIL